MSWRACRETMRRRADGCCWQVRLTRPSAASRCAHSTRSRPGDGGTPAGPVEGPVAEVKRLYVQPPYRHQGWGQRLAHALLDEARAIGYCELRLDTFDWMTGARSLYSGLGFRVSAPYYNNPLAGAVYMSLVL